MAKTKYFVGYMTSSSATSSNSDNVPLARQPRSRRLDETTSNPIWKEIVIPHLRDEDDHTDLLGDGNPEETWSFMPAYIRSKSVKKMQFLLQME